MEETKPTTPAAIHETDYAHPGYEAVHHWFGLSYANYLVLHRTKMQSMPEEWQARFVKCLKELEEAFDIQPNANSYRVQAVDFEGRFVKDPVPHYNRGRTRLPINLPTE